MIEGKQLNEPIIRKTWRNNTVSSSMIISIPCKLALKHHIKVGSNVVVEDTPEGILFRHLEIKE